MDIKKLEKRLGEFFKDRFNYLLILIIILLLTAPFLRLGQGAGLFTFLYGIFFVISNLFILKIMIERPVRFWIAALIFTVVFIFEIVVKRAGFDWAGWTIIVADMVYIVFLSIFLTGLFRALFNEKKVTSDSIKGGICIYFLLGILWGILYRILDFFDPTAFSFVGHEAHNLFYFSYVTLTTVGYGDIIPASRLAQTLAFMEAVTGQIFLGVFIARLMGLHIVNVVNHKES